MEKRLLIAFVLSMAVLFAYGLLFPQPKTVPHKPAEQSNTEKNQQTQTQQTAPVKKLAEEKPKAPSAAMPVRPSAPEKDVVVDTELYRAVISSRGGVIKSWELKKYTDTEGKPVEMEYIGEGVMPLLVVPEGVTVDDAGLMNYRIEGGDINLADNGEASLTLKYEGEDGRSITKRLSFTSGRYVVDVNVAVQGFDGYSLYSGEGFGSLTTKKSKGYGYTGPLTYIDGKLMDRGIVNWVKGLFKSKEEKEMPVKEFAGKSGWTGMTDKYFLAAIIPEGPIRALVEKGTSDWGYVGILENAKSGPLNLKFFAGPKEYDRLKALGGNLQDAVGFGFFAFIAKPLFVALKFFHGIVGNYGWSIVIITVIVKLLFAPLTHKQQKSMKRMQKLQPMISELKEKYKGDSQRMNTEMMELYKREKVNPLGGCLPMVIQIPVFVALYNVLNNAIELRHAPFILWIHDLSAKDPYYILPIVMGITMFITQRMTPTSADPNQNKIMMLLPVVFTFMFISLPSGLVLYFTLSNLLSMAQQLYINKTAEA